MRAQGGQEPAANSTCCGPGTSAASRVEFIWFSGCPKAAAMREALVAALKGLPHYLYECEQNALPDSDPRRTWPSPTILVGGTDLFGLSPRTQARNGSWSGTCRVYDANLTDPAVLRMYLADRLLRPPV